MVQANYRVHRHVLPSNIDRIARSSNFTQCIRESLFENKTTIKRSLIKLINYHRRHSIGKMMSATLTRHDTRQLTTSVASI